VWRWHRAHPSPDTSAKAELQCRKPRPVRRVSGAAGDIEDGLAALREVRFGHR